MDRSGRHDETGLKTQAAPITLLIHRANEGDGGALNEIFATLYPELRASHALRSGSGRSSASSTSLDNVLHCARSSFT